MKKPVHDVDLRLLRIFREVARRESFSLAAESLNTSLSNISTNIAQLESRLGMRLCERGVKGFRLTEQGRGVLEASRELYSSMDRYQERIDQLSGSLKREFRIGVLSEVVIERTVPLETILADLEATLPQTRFYLEFGPAVSLKEKVGTGELHAAIGYFEDLPDTMASVFLCRQLHACYCGRDHELFDTPVEEITADVLSSCRVAGYDDLFEDEKQRVPLLASYHSCSRTGEGILALVLTGNYIGLLVESFAAPWVAQGLLRKLDKPELELVVNISLIHRSDESESPTMRSMLEAVRRAFS